MTPKVVAIVTIANSKFKSQSVSIVNTEEELNDTVTKMSELNIIDIDNLPRSLRGETKSIPVTTMVYQTVEKSDVMFIIDQTPKRARSERNFFPMLMTLMYFNDNAMVNSTIIEISDANDLLNQLRKHLHPEDAVKIDLESYGVDQEIVVYKQDDSAIIIMLSTIPKEEGFEYDTEDSIALQKANEFYEMKKVIRASLARIIKGIFGNTSDIADQLRDALDDDNDHDCTKCDADDCPNHPNYIEELDQDDKDIDRREIN